MRLFRAFWIVLACIAPGAKAIGSVASGPRQSDASFAAAIRNQSTAPSYVRIAEIDGNTGKSRQTCVAANLLMSANFRENGRGNDAEGQMTALHIAPTTRSHVFTFTRRTALGNIPHDYSYDQLAQVRDGSQAVVEVAADPRCEPRSGVEQPRVHAAQRAP